MKTAEEIFNEHSFKAIGYISPSKDFCLTAMEEYAGQKSEKANLIIETYKQIVVTQEKLINHLKNQ